MHKWRRSGIFFSPGAEAAKPGVAAEPGSLGAGEVSKGEVRALNRELPPSPAPLETSPDFFLFD